MHASSKTVINKAKSRRVTYIMDLRQRKKTLGCGIEFHGGGQALWGHDGGYPRPSLPAAKGGYGGRVQDLVRCETRTGESEVILRGVPKRSRQVAKWEGEGKRVGAGVARRKTSREEGGSVRRAVGAAQGCSATDGRILGGTNQWEHRAARQRNLCKICQISADDRLIGPSGSEKEKQASD